MLHGVPRVQRDTALGAVTEFCDQNRQCFAKFREPSMPSISFDNSCPQQQPRDENSGCPTEGESLQSPSKIASVRPALIEADCDAKEKQHHETLPYQIVARSSGPEGWVSNSQPRPVRRGKTRPSPLRTEWDLSPLTFPTLIPPRPYCTNQPADGIVFRAAQKALEFRHVQFNRPDLLRWMIFDLDYHDAAFAHENQNVAVPHLIIQNPLNGHAHIAYLLKVPVQKFPNSRLAPLRFFAAVERGYRRRLKGDLGYRGVIAKNPLHLDWRTAWARREPYDLRELASWVDDADMMPEPETRNLTGCGRNCWLFDTARPIAYREVLSFKRNGGTAASWFRKVLAVCSELNLTFVGGPSGCLRISEVRNTAKSIASWTWRRFNDVEFSKIQSARAKQRYAGRLTAAQCLPWISMGMSRATYYRHMKQGALSMAALAQATSGQGDDDR